MRATVVLRGPMQRRTAAEYLQSAPDGTVVQFREPTRSLMQNSRLWATLNDISRDVVWHGRKLTPAQWKDIGSAALRKQEVVPGMDGTGFVVLGQSTSRMSVKEMSELLELLMAFGTEHGVRWTAPEGA